MLRDVVPVPKLYCQALTLYHGPLIDLMNEPEYDFKFSFGLIF